MKIIAANAYQNQLSRSNQPNFQARSLIIEDVFGAPTTIQPEALGKAYKAFEAFDGAKAYIVGILKQELNTYKYYSSDSLVCRIIKDKTDASAAHTRLVNAVNMALTTDGPPIHLDNNYNTLN
jgi:hypothetical protein